MRGMFLFSSVLTGWLTLTWDVHWPTRSATSRSFTFMKLSMRRNQRRPSRHGRWLRRQDVLAPKAPRLCSLSMIKGAVSYWPYSKPTQLLFGAPSTSVHGNPFQRITSVWSRLNTFWGFVSAEEPWPVVVLAAAAYLRSLTLISSERARAFSRSCGSEISPYLALVSRNHTIKSRTSCQNELSVARLHHKYRLAIKANSHSNLLSCQNEWCWPRFLW